MASSDMARFRFSRWEFDADSSATRRCYDRVKEAGHSRCPESICQNFFAAGTRAFPESVLDLFERLNVEFRCPAEEYWIDRVEPGLWWYGGWYHFVGVMRSGTDANEPMEGGGIVGRLEPVTETFRIGLSGHNPRLVAKAFDGLPLIQIDFDAYIPWVLSSPEPVRRFIPTPRWRRWWHRLVSRGRPVKLGVEEFK